MIFLILLVIFLIYMVAISFIYYNTAEKFSKNKEMFAMLGFVLPIMPIILAVLFMSISNFVLGHFLTFQIGENMLMFSLVGYTLFIFMLPQLLSAKWGRANALKENYNTSRQESEQAREPKEPGYYNTEWQSERMGEY